MIPLLKTKVWSTARRAVSCKIKSLNSFYHWLVTVCGIIWLTHVPAKCQVYGLTICYHLCYLSNVWDTTSCEPCLARTFFVLRNQYCFYRRRRLFCCWKKKWVLNIFHLKGEWISTVKMLYNRLQKFKKHFKYNFFFVHQSVISAKFVK